MIYFIFIVPFISALILLLFWKKFVIWWELIIPIVISVVFILIAKAICINSLTADVEWLGGYVIRANYYEDWNEEVPCRHPIYCRSCSGSGKTRTCHTYVCGHHHAYDVDYHPERWEVNTTLGTYSISKSKYLSLVKQFDVTPQFTDLHRDYHDNDGDMYHADWKGDDKGLEPVVIEENYENRPKAAVNVYHFDKPDTSDVKFYGLYEYPKPTSLFNQDLILGSNNIEAEKALQVLNARLGGPKQVRVFICLYRNKPMNAGIMQENYWEGGNKNEFVICIGINDNNEIQWAYDFSWTEKQECKVDVRSYIENQKYLDLEEIVKFTHKEMETKFVRKNFKDFDYLNIEPTFKQVIWILILVGIINVGIAFWIVVNDIDEDFNKYR